MDTRKSCRPQQNEQIQPVIQQELCITCGRCIQDCPAGVLQLDRNGVIYSGTCMACGHCVALCPCRAISLPGTDMDDVEEYDAATFTLQPEQLLHAIKFRRSTRSYTNAPIAPEILHDLVQCVRYTPTACNAQMTRLVIVQRDMPELVRLLWEELDDVIQTVRPQMPQYADAFTRLAREHKDTGKDGFFYGASALAILASANQWDTGLAAQNLELMAAAHGLGVLHSGFLRRYIEASTRVRAWLGLTDVPVGCCVLMGYPGVTYRRTAPRFDGLVDIR